MTVLLYVLGVLIFVVSILVSIGLHELGHMIPAKKFGGKVTQYFIGFGPTVWSRQVGETEYGVKAVPLGGYVKIVGMLPPGAEQLADETTTGPDGVPVTRVRSSNTGMFTQLISDARAAEWELVGPEDSERLFYKMAPWKKIVVMAAGPTVNLVIAFVLFLLIFGLYGIREREAAPGPPVVEVVSPCVLPYADVGQQCSDDDPASPAAQAGLRPGDTITSFNGTAVTDWDQLRGLIRDNAAGDATIGYERDGQALSGTTSTTVQARPDDDASATDTDPPLTQVGLPRRQPGHRRRRRRPRRADLHPAADGPHDRRHRQGARHAAGQGLGCRQGHRRRPGARGRQPGQHRGRRSARRRDRLAPGLPARREDRLRREPGRGLQLLHRDVQLRPAAAPRRRPHRQRRSGSGCAAASPGCAAVPTPATSTPPGCCRSPTSSPRRCWSWASCSSSADLVVPAAPAAVLAPSWPCSGTGLGPPSGAAGSGQ